MREDCHGGRPTQLVRRHFEEVWTQGKFDGFDDLYDGAYEGYVPLVGKVDRAGLKSVVNTYRRAFPDLKFEVQDIIQEGDLHRAVVRSPSGTSKGSSHGHSSNQHLRDGPRALDDQSPQRQNRPDRAEMKRMSCASSSRWACSSR